MKNKQYFLILIGLTIFLAAFMVGCGGYTQQDLDAAYRQGYIDGLNALSGEPSSGNEAKTSVPVRNWEISNLKYQITEKTNSWWKFSWQATLKNNTSSVVEFYITVNFLDRSGYIVDDDIEIPLVFSPGEQRVVRGYTLIDVDIASDVHDIEVAEVTAYPQ